MERTTQTNEFNYFAKLTHTGNWDEITVTFSIQIGLKSPVSFAGHAHPIMDNDQMAMESLSFLEAAKKAWTEKYQYSDEKVQKFVLESLTIKWNELHKDDKVQPPLNLLD
jgi:hypothetical protein